MMTGLHGLVMKCRNGSIHPRIGFGMQRRITCGNIVDAMIQCGITGADASHMWMLMHRGYLRGMMRIWNYMYGSYLRMCGILHGLVAFSLQLVYLFLQLLVDNFRVLEILFIYEFD